MKLARLVVGLSTYLVTNTAMAGGVLGAPLGVSLGQVLGAALGLQLGSALPIASGGLLTVAAVSLVVGIRIVRRKKNR